MTNPARTRFGAPTALRRGWRFAARLLALAAMVSFTASSARAQSLLSDAETEQFIRDITSPILEVAGITPQSVNFYIVADSNLNAFVALGQNIFVHTGLFTETDNVGQVIGVLAHETGHISGSHIARREEGTAAPTAITLISMLLGVAAIAAGAGEAGIGIIGGGQQAALRSFLSFTRSQEASADQAGAHFLEQLHLSGRGMLETFRKFATQEYLIGIPQDAYVRSHPLSGDRVASLETRVIASPYYDKPFDPAIEARYQRVKAKIRGFMDPPQATLNRFPASDRSVPARYARAYAYHKLVEIAPAMAEVDSLIAEQPNDPYFLELKGQLMVENGDVGGALAPLRQAVAIEPNEPQIRTLLGRALLSTEDMAFTEEAIQQLEAAARLAPEDPFTWFQLGQAYTNKGDDAMASLASAEYAVLGGRLQDTLMHARQAVKLLPAGSPSWYRAQDLLVLAESHRGEFEGRGGRR